MADARSIAAALEPVLAAVVADTRDAAKAHRRDGHAKEADLLDLSASALEAFPALAAEVERLRDRVRAFETRDAEKANAATAGSHGPNQRSDCARDCCPICKPPASPPSAGPFMGYAPDASGVLARDLVSASLDTKPAPVAEAAGLRNSMGAAWLDPTEEGAAEAATAVVAEAAGLTAEEREVIRELSDPNDEGGSIQRLVAIAERLDRELRRLGGREGGDR